MTRGFWSIDNLVDARRFIFFGTRARLIGLVSLISLLDFWRSFNNCKFYEYIKNSNRRWVKTIVRKNNNKKIELKSGSIHTEISWINNSPVLSNMLIPFRVIRSCSLYHEVQQWVKSNATSYAFGTSINDHDLSTTFLKYWPTIAGQLMIGSHICISSKR